MSKNDGHPVELGPGKGQSHGYKRRDLSRNHKNAGFNAGQIARESNRRRLLFLDCAELGPDGMGQLVDGNPGIKQTRDVDGL